MLVGLRFVLSTVCALGGRNADAQIPLRYGASPRFSNPPFGLKPLLELGLSSSPSLRVEGGAEGTIEGNPQAMESAIKRP